MELFKARASRFGMLGFNEADADDLAERLHLRDVHADHRHLCPECAHLAGHRSAGWRCRNHRAAQVARELPAALVTTMQHCPALLVTAVEQRDTRPQPGRHGG